MTGPLPAGYRVLVVDDEELVRSMLVRILRIAGIAADAVATGEDALAVIGRGTFGLVLSDLQLPGIGGLDLARTMAARGLDVPVVLLTGLAPELVEDVIGEHGLVRGVLHKPFRGPALLAAVLAATGDRRAWAARDRTS